MPAAPASRSSSTAAAAGPTASSPTASTASARRLRARGIRREERIFLCMLDTIDWPTAFLGAIKAGVIPVAVNTLLTESDYEFMLTDSRAKMLVVSQALLPKFAPILARCPDVEKVIVSGGTTQRLRKIRRRDRRRDARRLHGADHARRHGVLALFVGLDRKTKRHRAQPGELAPDRRTLCRSHSRHHRERSLLFGGEIVFRLRSRQRHDLPDVGRRHDRADGRAPDAGLASPRC